MGKYYENIDEIPIYNWFKISETNDLSFMVKDKKGKFDKSTALKKYEQLYDQYINEFGFGESFEKNLLLRSNIVSLKIEKAVTGNNFLNNFIRQAEIDLKDSMTMANRVSITETKVHVEKYVGFRLNEREVSVRDFYTYLKVMSKDIQKK